MSGLGSARTVREVRPILEGLDGAGVVTATVFWSHRSSSRLRRPRLGGHCGGRMPLHQGVQTMEVDGEGWAIGAGGNEEVADGGEDWDEALEAGPRAEALHHSLSFSDRDVGILGAIVQTLVRAMLDVRHDRALGGAIGSQLVGHHAFWPASLLFQKPR